MPTFRGCFSTTRNWAFAMFQYCFAAIRKWAFTMFQYCFTAIRKWASDYVQFKKAALFISGLISSNSFLKTAFQAFLMWYFEEIWQVESIRKAAISTGVSDITVSFLSIVAYHMAVDHIGCFWLIIFAVPCFIIGLLILWLFSFLLSKRRRYYQLLYLGLGIMTMGQAGEVALYPLLFDQFYPQKGDNNGQLSGDIANNNEEVSGDIANLNDQVSRDKTDNRASVWNVAASQLGMFTCWAFASSLDWNQAFVVTIILMTVAYLLFCCGTCYYKRNDPTRRTVVSRTIDAKRLLKLIPLCLTFIPYSLADASGDTFFIVQSYRLDQSINPRIAIGSVNRVPVTSLYVFQNIISTITSMSSNFLIGKSFWRSENIIINMRNMYSRAGYVRIGIGMLFAFGSCLSAWLVEVRKSNLIKKRGIPDDKDIRMKILWLAPQFGLLGIANGLLGEGMGVFFCDRLPQSMWFFVVPLTLMVTGIGRFISVISILLATDWIRDSEGENHLDKYFLMLAILNISVLVVYALLSYMFDWNIKDHAHNETGTPMEEVDGGRETGTSVEEVDGRRAGD